ncbi:MAG TPA: TolC family protein [Smithella sp.]|nr:TolC family protein [Smithella sp.]MDM7988119.1 TolC family protein [Smithella sp.]HNY49181.1 TolC family protein [Smithella sp.]HOG90057.1 TolC family protein [Smithella sp.]HOU49627.1 TolC family protein [Smithella sp.]
MSISSRLFKLSLLLLGVFLMAAAPVQGDPTLEGLIAEALQNSPEIKASEAGIEAARLRITQAGSLPDPMIMAGYQNEGFDSYTYGEMEGSQWMFSASQQFLFPGKRSLKEEMTRRDAESLEAMHEQLKLKTAARVRELYYDLFLAHKNIDLLKEKRDLIARMESMVLARYAAGTAMQQDVIMTQTEKYMLLEKVEMGRQKIQSLEAMLKAVIGRHQGDQVPKPTEPVYQSFSPDINEVIKLAMQNSPELKSRHKMLEAANAKVAMARKEYYPDFALSGGYYNRSGDFPDMWAATVTFNIPLYFQSKQKPAEMEAKAGVNQADRELAATQLMIEAALRDNYTMLRSAERLMELYKEGILPKTRQDIEQTLTGYSTGRGETVTILSRLKTLLDYELLYWGQLVEREKAIARLQAIATGLNGKGEKQ